MYLIYDQLPFAVIEDMMLKINQNRIKGLVISENDI